MLRGKLLNMAARVKQRSVYSHARCQPLLHPHSRPRRKLGGWQVAGPLCYEYKLFHLGPLLGVARQVASDFGRYLLPACQSLQTGFQQFIGMHNVLLTEYFVWLVFDYCQAACGGIRDAKL
jgi:hypothetical protein